MRKTILYLAVSTLIAIPIQAQQDRGKLTDHDRKRLKTAREKIERHLKRAKTSATTVAEKESANAFKTAKEQLEKAFLELTLCRVESGDLKRHPELARLQKEVVDVGKMVYRQVEPFLENLLKIKHPPKDRYQAKDRKKIEDVVHMEWKSRWPNDEIIAIRFPKDEWKEERFAVTDKPFKSKKGFKSEFNVSSLQVTVLIRQTGKIPTGYRAYYVRNLRNWSESARVETKGSPSEDYLISLLK